MREAINTAYKEAMKARDQRRVGTLRLITAAFKEKDIEVRGGGQRGEASDDELLAVLQKMIKQRQESAAIYTANGRPELAAQENEEAAIIREYLPAQLDDDAMQAAIAEAIASTGAAGPKDMGKVMTELRAKYAGRMDFAKVSGLLKDRLK
jgi:uncharacterized protein YqeY